MRVFKFVLWQRYFFKFFFYIYQIPLAYAYSYLDPSWKRPAQTARLWFLPSFLPSVRSNLSDFSLKKTTTTIIKEVETRIESPNQNRFPKIFPRLLVKESVIHRETCKKSILNYLITIWQSNRLAHSVLNTVFCYIFLLHFLLSRCFTGNSSNFWQLYSQRYVRV